MAATRVKESDENDRQAVCRLEAALWASAHGSRTQLPIPAQRPLASSHGEQAATHCLVKNRHILPYEVVPAVGRAMTCRIGVHPLIPHLLSEEE